MNRVKGMECISCRGKVAYDAKKVQYLCPECGGNLEILFDYQHIGKYFTREALAASKDFSMWRYAPLLPIQDLSRIPPLHIGWTPLYHAGKMGAVLGMSQLYLKDDGRNPSASLKDRAGAVALVCALERGISSITGASTGNAGSSMACLCASVGIRPVIFVPEKAPRAKIAQLLLYGARVLMVRGTYDEAFDLCLKVSDTYGWFNRNTGYNPFTREGKKTCILEICEQLMWDAPDWVFVSVGDGNIISGMWKGLRDLNELGFIKKLPRICAVQSEKSNAVAQAVKNYQDGPITVKPVKATTIADSISVDLPRDGIAAVRAVLETKGEAVEVSDEEILENIKFLAHHSGIFGEPAGVTSLAGLRKLLKKGIVKPDEKVACIITGNGLKDVDSALKVAGSGETIDPTLEAVKKVLEKN
ncbi:MAG: threonine synthase [Candidatus Eremiobacteraeota bacterium]|nr:threonine synthase [Candidatus Eremiobacteraeota bacterium]